MVSKLIQAMISIVIGLALLPVVVDFTDQLTTSGGDTGDPGALYDSAAGTLVELLPILYVIILVSGIAGWVYTTTKR